MRCFKISCELMLLVAALTSRLIAISPSFAQNPPSDSTPSRSLTDQVMERARRPHNFMNLINDKDPAVRLAALETALKDQDPTVRGMALSGFLKRFDALTPEVVLDSASSTAQEDVPRLALINVKWPDDGNSFVGQLDGCGSGYVRGQIAGGKLVINFPGVCVRTSLLTKDSNGNRGKGDQLQTDSCQLTMMPDEQGDRLEGPLHCVGMSSVFKVELPFGA